MFKTNNKKMLTVLIAVAMIFSAFAILSFAAQPAYATSSGTVTYNPTTLGVTSSSGGVLISTVAFVSGGTFSSGSTVYFYLSTTDSATGIVSDDAIGSTTLTAASPTSLNQAVTFSSSFTVTPGTYYILASNVPSPLSSPSALTSFAFPAAATAIVVQTASFEVLNAINGESATGSNALTVGGTGIAAGTGFDPGATVSVTLNYPGGSVLTTATANSFGEFKTTFTVPQLSGTVNTAFSSVFITPTPYTVVAQETNALSSSFPQGDITSDAPMDIAPTITVTPMDISGAAGSSFSISGTGFPAGGSIALSSSSSPSTTIEIETLSGSSVTSTYHPAVTVSSNGQFTVTVTTASAISTTGPYSILITLTDTAPYASSIDEYFTAVLYVSVPNPQSPGFYFSPVPVEGYYLPVLSPLTAAVFDFPAGVSVSVYLGSTLIGSVTTDSNGFGILPVTTIPAIPAGTYIATAVDSSQHIVTPPTAGVTTSISVTAFWEARDPLGNLLFENEFVPQNGTIMFAAYGLSPSSAFFVFDGAIGNVATSGTNVTVTVGSVSPSGFFVPADNGTLIMSYQPFYGYYGISTGTVVPLGTTPSLLNLAGILISGSTPGYREIGAPTLSVSPTTSLVGGSATIDFSNLIYSVPDQTFYPGTSGFYNFYIGTTKIVSSGVSVFTSFPPSVTFTVPSLASGLYNISVTYAGQPLSDALPVYNTATAMLVVSTPGKSTSSGSMVTVPTYSDGAFSGYAIAGYGLIASTSADLVIYNSEGPTYVTINPGTTYAGTTGKDGAFLDTSDLSTAGSIYSGSAGGTWGIVLTVAPSTPTAFEFYSSYTVTATFTPGSLYIPGVYILGGVESSVTFSASGLMPDANYVIVFNGNVLTNPVTGLPITYTSSSSGAISSETFEVPLVYVSESVGYSVYPVSIAPLSSPSTPAATVLGIVLWPSTISIQPDPAAFPGELVSFTWMPSPSETPYPPAGAPIYVTVYLNGYPYVQVPATVSYVTLPNGETAAFLSGSFKMPNGMPGTNMTLSFGYSYTTQTAESVSVSNSMTADYSVTFAPTSSAPTPTTITETFPSLGDVSVTSPTITGPGTYTAPAATSSGYTVLATFVVTEASLEANTGTGGAAVDSITYHIYGTYSTTSGSFPFEVGSQSVTTSTAISSSTTESGTTIGTYETVSTINSLTQVSYKGITIAPIRLVSGGGALLVNISASQIATLIVDVSKAVTTSMQIPLSELNATLVAINGTVAKLSTAFGNMTASLKAINATIAGIANGQAIINTTLGKITASLSSLNASIVSLSGNVAVINTTLGQVTASLKAINATVSSIMNGQAVINTTLGKITASLSSL
ncbi:MAG: hypothetical protein QXP36_06550, partial [Conexivisphaerales archaeon]